jgi:hypothetical protein
MLTIGDGLYSLCGGGWKCPEEEHTTCSGGPTINCHKRGLRGERIFIKWYFINIIKMKMLEM